MRNSICGLLLFIALQSTLGCSTPTPVAGSSFDAESGLATDGAHLQPSSLDVQVLDKVVALKSAPGTSDAQIVDYIVFRKETGEEMIHIETSQSLDDYPVEISRARFYGGNYIFRAYDNVTRKAFSEKTVFVPDYDFFAHAGQ